MHIPVWLQPLTRWPFMQDWHAYFSPSIIGMPTSSRPNAIVAAPDCRYAILPDRTPPSLAINPYDVRTFSLISLTKKLRTVGLASRACDEISKRGNLYYKNAWNEYEDIHGEEHPRRYFDRLAPAAS